MNVQQLKVYSTMLKNYRNGVGSDVFELMYQSSLDYGEVKSVLDGLILDGDAEMLDIKTYGLIGDVEARAAVIFEAVNRSEPLEEGNELLDNPDDFDLGEDEDAELDELESLFKRIKRECDDDDDDDEIPEDDEDDEEDCVEAARRFYCGLPGEYTSDVTLILEKAFAFVEMYDHGYVSPEHILYAIMFTTGVARDLLFKYGVEPSKYAEYFFRTVDKDFRMAGFTPLAEFVLERAAELARHADPENGCAGQEHLLLAILTATDTVGVSILQALKVDIKSMIDELEEIVYNQE